MNIFKVPVTPPYYTTLTKQHKLLPIVVENEIIIKQKTNK